METSSTIDELRKRFDSGDFRITVLLGDTTFLCFPVNNSVDIYRLEGNLITYHAKEISPDLDGEEIELHCLSIEEQYAADKCGKGITPTP